MKHNSKSHIARNLALLCIIPLVMAPRCSAASVPAKNLGEKPLSTAEYSFPVNNIQLNGNTVSFIVAENANEYNKKADAVILSGIYASDQSRAAFCPVVDSHYVDKKVKNYNPFSGRAEIIATFDDPADAASAAKSGCLLIHDVD